MTIMRFADVPVPLKARLAESDEVVATVAENAAVYFAVQEICDEFFGGQRVCDTLVQEYADTLAANIESPEDFDDFVTLVRSNFNDNFHDMMDDLREKFIEKMVKRERALYAIALSCFNELCAPLDEVIVKQRLDSAIEATIKEQSQ